MTKDEAHLVSMLIASVEKALAYLESGEPVANADLFYLRRNVGWAKAMLKADE
jgi:hypothetical protein